MSMHRRLAAPLLAVLALAAGVAPAHAGDPWSPVDRQREAAYLVLHAIDWGQTLYIADHPDTHHEQNPLLGPHPTRGRVHGYFAATALLHVGLVHVLPARWRPAVQMLSIAIEAGTVASNWRAGVRLAF